MNARGVLFVVALAGAGCAQVISADFDGLGPKESSGGGAGSAGKGGGSGASGSGGDVGGGGAGGASDGSVGGGGAGGAGGTGTVGTGGRGGSGGATGTGGARDGGADGRAGSGGATRPDAAAGDASVRDGGANDASVSDARAGDGGTARDAAPETASPDDVAVPDAPVDTDARGPLIVINEIRAVDADWIELYNPGPAAASLDGIGLTQARGTNGPPDSAALLTFASGARVAAGAFVVVAGKQSSIGGPFTTCGGLAASCYWVSWGISASGGESVYIVSTLSTALPILETVTYPLASQAPPAGKSYGRLPDGTGAFTSTTPTPGAVNQP